MGKNWKEKEKSKEKGKKKKRRRKISKKKNQSSNQQQTKLTTPNHQFYLSLKFSTSPTPPEPSPLTSALSPIKIGESLQHPPQIAQTFVDHVCFFFVILISQIWVFSHWISPPNPIVASHRPSELRSNPWFPSLSCVNFEQISLLFCGIFSFRVCTRILTIHQWFHTQAWTTLRYRDNSLMH